MKKMKFLTLLVSAALVLALLSPAALAAASTPQLDASPESGGLRLTVSGLASGCQGLQVTVLLSSAGPVDMTFAGALNAGGVHTACTQNGAEVTLYVVSKGTLGEGGRLELGALSGAAAVSSVSGWKVLTAADLEGESFQPPAGTNPPSWTPVDPPDEEPEPEEPSQPVAAPPAARPATPGEPPAPSQPVLPAMPFTDVAAGDWFYDAVSYVYRTGLMNGMSESAFVPGGTTTRAQIVTILHRLEGEPADTGVGFVDVPDGQWFTTAVRWAAANGIVDGYGGGLFGPADQITREQMAAILYRYARFKGYDTSAAGDLTVFADTGRVSSWAWEAMTWANGSGLITGKSTTTLDPQGTATRAEAATILMRFRENFTQ